MTLKQIYALVICTIALFTTGTMALAESIDDNDSAPLPLPSQPFGPGNPANNTPSAPASSSTTPAPDFNQVNQPIKPHATDTKRVWNLQDVDLLTLVKEVSQETGKNFIIDPQVQGKVTFVSGRAMTPAETYQVFLSILDVYGYAAIPSPYGIKIVPNSKAKQMALPLASKKYPGRGDEMVVRVIPVNHASASALVPILRNLLPSDAHLASYADTNILVAAGKASTMSRFAAIVGRIDRNGSDEIELIPLRYATASDTVQTLQSLLRSSSSPGGLSASAAPLTLSADDRNNSILMSGDKTKRAMVRTLLKNIDTPTKGGSTEVIYLKYQKAEDLVPVLANMVNAYYQQKSGKQPGSAASGGSGFGGGGMMANLPPLGGQPFQPPTPAFTLSTGSSDSGSSNSGSVGSDSGAGATAQPRQSVSANGIQSEPHTNALIISAPPELMRSLKTVIAKLDIRRAQVLVEAIIAELSDTQAQELGIEWQKQSAGIFGDIGYSNSSTPPSGSMAGLSGKDGQVDFGKLPAAFGLNVGFLHGGSIRSLLHAINSTNDANLLSTPSVTVMDNEQASIKVLTTIPVQTGRFEVPASGQGNPFTTIGSRDVGLVLNFTPQITQGDTVQMVVYQETGNVISNADPLNPVTSKRSIKTSVQVNSQDILVLGGLISSENKNTINKVPFLGDIPGLGALFRSKSQSVDKRNLMVFLRPTILRSEDDTVRVANGKYDFMRDQEILKQHDPVRPNKSESDAPLLPSRVPDPQVTQLPIPFG